MLPEALSNELCSLKPEVDRLCMVCDLEVSARGLVKGYRFYRGVMHSQARLTYDSVWEWLSAAEARRPVPSEARPLMPHLANLYAVYRALGKARVERGAIDFDTPEMQLEFDVHGKIERIVPVVRNEAHRLIEECMLAANVCTAEFLAKHEHPALYRVHEGPTPEKLALLREFLGTKALSLARWRRADRRGLRGAPREHPRAPRFRAAADGAAALVAAGAVPPRERRPFRPRLRGLRPFHLADPSLSRSAGAPRGEGRARRPSLQAFRRLVAASSARIAR